MAVQKVIENLDIDLSTMEKISNKTYRDRENNVYYGIQEFKETRDPKHLGLWSLICGFLGLLTPTCLLGIIFGHIALRKASKNDYINEYAGAGLGFAYAGLLFQTMFLSIIAYSVWIILSAGAGMEGLMNFIELQSQSSLIELR